VDIAEQTLTLPDGRQLEILTAGSPEGPTVVLQHGTPGSRTTLIGHAEAMADHGFFFVATSRAGYGTSSRREGRRAKDVVGDIHSVLDQLGRDAYVTVGFSGGGPQALACAALGAPRCRGAISLAGVAPSSAFDWFEGASEEDRAAIATWLTFGEAFHAGIQEGYEKYRNCTDENGLALWEPLFSAPDMEAVQNQPGWAHFGNSVGHAFSVGPWGYYDDNVSTFSEWGFDPRDITVPVGVWYGDEDKMVDKRHGDYLSATIPNARQHHHPAEGHMSIVSSFAKEIGDEIASFF